MGIDMIVATSDNDGKFQSCAGREHTLSKAHLSNL